ncbi:hypothetical protein GCM10009624_28460 [Gordonia sinesedis]
MSRPSDAEYAAMSDDYIENPPADDEVAGEIAVNPAVLRTGRPRGASQAKGRTPTTSVRLPEELRKALARRARIENAADSEVIRRAVVEYLERHPA